MLQRAPDDNRRHILPPPFSPTPIQSAAASAPVSQCHKAPDIDQDKSLPSILRCHARRHYARGIGRRKPSQGPGRQSRGRSPASGQGRQG
jgi:hypothetical protein